MLTNFSMADGIENINRIAFVHQATTGEGHAGPLKHDFFELIKLL